MKVNKRSVNYFNNLDNIRIETQQQENGRVTELDAILLDKILVSVFNGANSEVHPMDVRNRYISSLNI